MRCSTRWRMPPPRPTMAQAIREVDQATDEVRSELGRVEAVKHLASRASTSSTPQKETLAEQIDIAMAKGDEALARAGIARQIDIDDQIPVLQRSLQDAIGRGKELEGYIAALRPRSARWNRRCRISSRRGRRDRLRPPRTRRAAPRRKGRPRRLGLRPGARARDRPRRRPVGRSIRTPPSCGSCRTWRARTGSTSASPR